ncbi:UDP-glycosyltransferase 85A5, partial [Dichanthelium oligosanthes]
LVPAGGGAAARGGGRVPDALRVELDDGEPMRRGADAVLALLRGAADQLPVQVHGVGHGHDGEDVRSHRVPVHENSIHLRP